MAVVLPDDDDSGVNTIAVSPRQLSIILETSLSLVFIIESSERIDTRAALREYQRISQLYKAEPSLDLFDIIINNIIYSDNYMELTNRIKFLMDNREKISKIENSSYKKRVRDQLPDPSAPASAWINATKRDVKVRVLDSVRMIFEEARAAEKMTMNSWITRSCLRAAREEGIDIPEDLRYLLEDPDY